MTELDSSFTDVEVGLGIPGKPGILLIEDVAEHLEPVANHLITFGGFEVYKAKTVQKALSIAKQYPTLRFVAMDMGLPDNEDKASYSQLSGIILLRELVQILPKAKIYIKSSLVITETAKKFLRAYSSSIVRVGGGWDPDEIVDKAKIAYSEGGMRPHIFIVHGHDSYALEELKHLVKDDLRLGEPTVIRDKQEAGHIIMEKFEEYARQADLVFALLTPDDMTDSGHRARQNVIFELGYFTAALGRKSGKLILLHHRDAEKPSDIDGMLTIDITEGVRKASAKIRNELKGWWGMDVP